MWTKLAGFTLRNRAAILIVLGVITIFMGYKATYVELDYNLPRLLPEDDKANIDYNHFIEVFGYHGNIVVLGIRDEEIYKLRNFNAWYDMGNSLKEIEGVDEIISIAHLFNLTKNKKEKKFDFKPIVSQKPQSQQELDSLKNIITSLPFYEGVIYNKENPW